MTNKPVEEVHGTNPANWPFNTSLGYGSHAPVLMAAVARTKGDVLELGMGHFSTPALHLMCEGRRGLVSVETDCAWLENFLWMESPDHEIIHIGEDEWEDLKIIEERKWAVAFVDSKPGEGRARLVERLAESAHHIVVHDTETDYATAADYKLEPVFEKFKYRWDMKRYRPYTTVVSNFHPFGSLNGGRCCDGGCSK